MKLSKKAVEIQPSLTLEITAKAKKNESRRYRCYRFWSGRARF